MKKMKLYIKNMIRAFMLCLSLFVTAAPAFSMDMPASSTMVEPSAKMVTKIMSRHCDKMKNMGSMPHDCCETASCDCSCMTVTPIFLLSEIQGQQSFANHVVPDSFVIILRPQYSYTPTPPPII